MDHVLISEGARVWRFVLKSEKIRRITLLRKQSWQKRLIWVQAEPAMRQPYKPVVMRISSRKEARSTGAALGRRAEEVGEQNPFAREPVQVRRLYASTVTS